MKLTQVNMYENSFNASVELRYLVNFEDSLFFKLKYRANLK